MTLLLSVAQLNYVVGDMAGNAQKIIEAARTGYQRGVRLLLTPELSICGYAAEDLFLRPSFIRACDDALKTITTALADLKGLHVVVGHPSGGDSRTRSVSVVQRFNRASVLSEGQVVAFADKRELPNYQVFDERRYFTPGQGACVVDVAGINRLSRVILAQAAGAICGMVSARPPEAVLKPVIVASQFGNTTACVTHAREILEAAGYEVMIFAATGTGGRTLESLVESGLVSGVLDVTTTEWADELVGGVLNAGPTRCEAAARAGVPAIVTPGCLDMVNFGEPATVPARFAGRRFYHHNAQVTLMRTNPEECAQLGKVLAEKCNMSKGPIRVFIPLRGISVISAPGQPFHWPEADAALFEAWKSNLRQDIPVTEYDGNINDPEFARLCAEALLELVRR